MKFLKIIIFLGVVFFLGMGIFNLEKEINPLREELADFNEKIFALEQENQELQDRIEYFSHIENLLKEAKSQFNYLNLGEKLMIVVPKRTD